MPGMPGAPPPGLPGGAPGAYPGQPPMMGAPGAPPAQQGMQGPQMGFGIGAGGGLRLNYQGGDFSPGNLVAAVTTGRGFSKPRLMGAALFGLALLFSIGNWALVMVLNRFYPYLYSLAAIFAWGGLWLLITGQPAQQADGSPAPMWGRIGLAACLVIGVLAGVAMVIMPWEDMITG